MKNTSHDIVLQDMRDRAAANNITWTATKLGWRATLSVPGDRHFFDSETEYGALKRAFDEVNKNMPCIQRSSLIEQQAHTATASLNEIYDARDVVAQAEWESYDLGNYECEDCSGWEWTIPGNTMTRPIFLAGQGDEPSIAAQFTVEFKHGTAEIINAYASCDGETIGQRANPSQVQP